MSAPNTNVDKQKKRHRGPLWGMWGGIGVVVLLFLVWLIWTAYYGQTPRDADQIDGRTGEVEQPAEQPAVVDPDAETAPAPAQ